MNLSAIQAEAREAIKSQLEMVGIDLEKTPLLDHLCEEVLPLFTQTTEATYRECAEVARKKAREATDDERMHYDSANVNINAPLALIQMGLEAQEQTANTIAQALEDRANSLTPKQ